MNSGEHITVGSEHVDDEQNGQNPALAELRKLLVAGMAQARLNQTDLAGLSGLGRTTVSEALSAKRPAPSAQTVTAMARALKMPVRELLELQRTAAATSSTIPTGGPGRPIREWEPHALEVHPAGPGSAASGSGTPAVRALPGYVPREHDVVLADAVRDAAAGHSRIVVLVGTSSTGKTRACWEAIQPLADRGWRLWHPYQPSRAQAALEELHQLRPRTVVWLNEAQHYLGDRGAGERIAAAVHHLLVTPERGPVLVLGTLWPEYAHSYTSLPEPGGADPHGRVRELLAGRTLTVPNAFDTEALAAATVLAEGGDRLLGDALTRARTSGRVTQDLAGAPELLNRYDRVSPAAKALLEVAMDARRLGVGLHLPQTFLTDAVTDYLDQSDYDQLTDDWAERAYAELAELVHGKQAPLRRTTPRLPRRPPTPAITSTAVAPPLTAGPQFRLADYLEQHARVTRHHVCPLASFWHAAHTHLTHPDDLNSLALAAESRHRLQWAHHLRHRAADHGSAEALRHLATLREQAGDWEEAEDLARRAANHGDTSALSFLAWRMGEAGDWERAEDLARQAANHGDTSALYNLASVRDEDGDRESAARLLQQAADHDSTNSLHQLAALQERAEARKLTSSLAQRAADYDRTNILYSRFWLEEVEDLEAEQFLQHAADRGNTTSLRQLATLRKQAGDVEGAERFLQQSADRGNIRALHDLAIMRGEAGDWERAGDLARQAADHGESRALYRLAELREEDGDGESAALLLLQAADHGDTWMSSVPTTERQMLYRLWPNGLDPDGTPTPQWEP
ncbi:hypothetical protein [Streptomyces canus]|uniref:hypothetical protein n=1 Tax=Streptomyces canus TaxID=58343 RepID=UPI0030DF34AB